QVTKRTLYAYYGDKAEVFAAMVRDLAASVSLDAASDRDTLETLAARIVSRVHSDELVGLHQLVIGESARSPERALILHSSGDARHIARLAGHLRAERGLGAAPLAEPLFSLLLGEKHRRRLLGIDPAPTLAQAAASGRPGLRLSRPGWRWPCWRPGRGFPAGPARPTGARPPGSAPAGRSRPPRSAPRRGRGRGGPGGRRRPGPRRTGPGRPSSPSRRCRCRAG